MYLEYDNLYVTVKADKLEELTSHYKCLGWERVEVKEHRIYSDELNASFRRPHFIGNKDALQLMQVYLDESLNDLAKIRGNFCPKSTAFAVIFSVLSVAALISGLCLALVLGNAWFYALCAFGGALAAFTVIVSIISFRREKINVKNRAERDKATITRVCEAAEKLGGSGND